jgi:hypothetical protein
MDNFNACMFFIKPGVIHYFHFFLVIPSGYLLGITRKIIIIFFLTCTHYTR